MALSRLWSLVEDATHESRHGAFSGYDRSHRQATMVDAIRMGNVGLYFRSGDNRVGRIVRRKNKWITEFIIDGQGQERVLHLFELFKKQIRVGFLTCPAFFRRKENDVTQPLVFALGLVVALASTGYAKTPADKLEAAYKKEFSF